MRARVFPLVGLICFFCIWEIVAKSSPKTSILFPAPSNIFFTVLTLASSGYWWNAVFSSLKHYLLGVLVGSICGFSLGVICAESKAIFNFSSGIIALLRPIPPLAWVPLSVLWFGVSGFAATFIIAVGVFWVIFDGSLSGISSVDPKYLELAASCNRNTLINRLFEISIPASLPTLIASVRSGLGLGWMLLVAAEIVGVPGIGQRMWEGAGVLATEEVMVCMLTIALCYSVVNVAVQSVERRYIWWADE